MAKNKGRGDRIRAAEKLRAAAKHKPTLAMVLQKRGLIDELHGAIQAMNTNATVVARDGAKLHLRVVSCDTCDAPKGCCKGSTPAFLHETVPLVAMLKREGRDTPELRASLLAAAEKMEQSTRAEYLAPCVFLGPAERCTVYDVRPQICGTTLVVSPPAQCSDRENGMVERFDDGHFEKTSWSLAQAFYQALGLHDPTAHSAMGMLPRMVLVCLEAWDRQDYQTFLTAGDWGLRAYRATGQPFPIPSPT